MSTGKGASYMTKKVTIFPAKAENSELTSQCRCYNPKITSYGTEIKAKSETPSIKTKSENAKCHYLHSKLNQVVFVSSTTTTTEMHLSLIFL